MHRCLIVAVAVVLSCVFEYTLAAFITGNSEAAVRVAFIASSKSSTNSRNHHRFSERRIRRLGSSWYYVSSNNSQRCPLVIFRATSTPRVGDNSMESDTNSDKLVKDHDDYDDSHRLVLPIFPLRKTVRLPTEMLTLNLYEERYLEMAEWILGMDDANATTNTMAPRSTLARDVGADQSQKSTRRLKYFFGALYTSGKAQIVKDAGMGPIVPIVEAGDVGVIFSVEQWQDDLVPTRDELYQRRRIRLVGTGLARFRIERIMHNGYDDTSSSDASVGSGVPYIVAETSIVLDEPIKTGKEKERIQRLLTEVSSRAANVQKEERDQFNSDNIDDTNAEDEVEDAATPMPSGTNSEISGESVSSPPIATRELLLQGVAAKDKKHLIQEEMESFAAASSILPKTSTLDRLSVLSMSTLSERLQYLNDKIALMSKKGKAPWSSWW